MGQGRQKTFLAFSFAWQRTEVPQGYSKQVYCVRFQYRFEVCQFFYIQHTPLTRGRNTYVFPYVILKHFVREISTSYYLSEFKERMSGGRQRSVYYRSPIFRVLTVRKEII